MIELSLKYRCDHLQMNDVAADFDSHLEALKEISRTSTSIFSDQKDKKKNIIFTVSTLSCWWRQQKDIYCCKRFIRRRI